MMSKTTLVNYLSASLCICFVVGCGPDEKKSDDAKPFDLNDDNQDMDVVADLGDVVPDMSVVITPDMDITPDMLVVDPVDMGTPVEDMPAVVDMGVDLGEEPDMPVVMDMPPDMPPVQPLREVVDRGLMGGIPMENFIKDPTFNSLNTAYAWLVTPGQSTGQGFSLLPAYRHVPATSPMSAAALKVPKTSGNSVSVYGEVIMHPDTPVTVSVWLGRKGFVLGGGGSSPPEVIVYALNVANFYDYSGVELVRDQASAISMDGILWSKYEAQVSGLAGYGYLTINDDSSSDLYIHAPMSVATPPPAPTAAVRPPAPMQLVSPDQSESLQQLNAFVFEKRSVPRQARETGPTPYPF